MKTRSFEKIVTVMGQAIGVMSLAIVLLFLGCLTEGLIMVLLRGQ
jgi:hypothetical protein